MPPEYIERCEITSKYDVFSLGVIIIRIMAGHEGYYKCPHMSSQEFIEHVWKKYCIMNKTLLHLIQAYLTFRATFHHCVQPRRYMKTGDNGYRQPCR
jgi:serine/threonine protein kinase